MGEGVNSIHRLLKVSLYVISPLTPPPLDRGKFDILL